MIVFAPKYVTRYLLVQCSVVTSLYLHITLETLLQCQICNITNFHHSPVFLMVESVK